MHLTALNAKSELEPELVSEFAREFDSEPPEAIAWVFQEQRKLSNFFPSIRDIGLLLNRWHKRTWMEQDMKQRLEEQRRIKQARADGKLLDFSEVMQELRASVRAMPQPARPGRGQYRPTLNPPILPPGIKLTQVQLMELAKKCNERRAEFEEEIRQMQREEK